MKDGDHIYFHHEINGQATGAYTFVSHSKKYRDIDKANLAATRVQLKLDKTAQVLDLVNCPMDAEEYIRLLREKGILD